MSKKQMLGSVLILILLSFICMFIYDKFKNEQENRETKLIVEKGDNKLTLYYTDTTGRNYYLYGLDKITVDYGDRSLELNKALEAKQFTMDEVIQWIGYSNKETYWDGGSTKINNQDISLLMCQTVGEESNRDYYFGTSDMKKREGFCEEEPYICSFTRTYLVLDISASNDDKYVYLTLKMFQDEEVVTVKIDKDLVNDVVEDKYYEFQFTSIGNSSENDIQSIFKNHKLVSIQATDKTGLDQINENICH